MGLQTKYAKLFGKILLRTKEGVVPICLHAV